MTAIFKAGGPTLPTLGLSRTTRDTASASRHHHATGRGRPVRILDAVNQAKDVRLLCWSDRAGSPHYTANLRVEVPTVKGAVAKAPAVVAFEVTSKTQEDIESFLREVHALVCYASRVLVGTARL